MNLINTYFKAFREYQKAIAASERCISKQQDISDATSDNERISATYNVCKIEDDWIIAIEEGLTHIEKAIKEERLKK